MLKWNVSIRVSLYGNTEVILYDEKRYQGNSQDQFIITAYGSLIKAIWIAGICTYRRKCTKEIDHDIFMVHSSSVSCTFG